MIPTNLSFPSRMLENTEALLNEELETLEKTQFWRKLFVQDNPPHLQWHEC